MPTRTPTSPVTAFVSRSSSNTFPKFHLDIGCSGLQRVVVWPEQDRTLTAVDYDSYHALGIDDTGRPCRVCALEQVLDVVLRPKSKRHKLVFTSFTSQGNPDENPARYKFSASTESGQERLYRIANRLDLPVVRSSSGPVAYGFLPHMSIPILRRNLRTFVRDDVTELPSGPTIECLWALLDDNPPERRSPFDVDDTADPWEIAELLAA